MSDATSPRGASVAGAMHRERAHPDCRCAVCYPPPEPVLPSMKNRRLAETMGDYRNIAAAQEGDDPALDDLAEVVCQTGGHIPPRDRDREACDFHRRMAAGYLRVVESASAPTVSPPPNLAAYYCLPSLGEPCGNCHRCDDAPATRSAPQEADRG